MHKEEIPEPSVPHPILLVIVYLLKENREKAELLVISYNILDLMPSSFYQLNTCY